jgi:hypothetical protein
MIQTSDLCFIKRDLSQLNYLLRTLGFLISRLSRPFQFFLFQISHIPYFD